MVFNLTIGLCKQLGYGNATEIIAARTFIPRVQNFQHMLKTRLFNCIFRL